jgi:uncharacterized lipoprotein YajG
MNRTILIALLVLTACMAPGTIAVAAEKGAPAKAGNADAARTASIAYDDLREHLGERIVVQTRVRTTRVGTLTKFSKMELTLTVDTPTGPSEITIPKDNVVRATPADKPAPAKR